MANRPYRKLNGVDSPVNERGVDAQGEHFRRRRVLWGSGRSITAHAGILPTDMMKRINPIVSPEMRRWSLIAPITLRRRRAPESRFDHRQRFTKHLGAQSPKLP